MQTTLASPATFSGIGLHSGRPVRCVVHPAPADHGIVFVRTDSAAPVVAAARWDQVRSTALNTGIGASGEADVLTVEHLMAALHGCGIHNARIDLHGPELPALDGSAARFVRGLLGAGIARLEAPLSVIEVTAPVTVHRGEAWARIEPFDGFEIDMTIDFPDAAIGRQSRQLDLANGAFVRELCDSRTFCRLSDIEGMRREGLALGGAMENAVVVDGARVLNPGGFRHPDEAVRHKMLDVVGDLALAGLPILGRYVGYKSGHALTNSLLRVLLTDRQACRVRPCDKALLSRLPGAGLGADDLAAVA